MDCSSRPPTPGATFDNSTADVFSTVLTPRRPQDFQCFACDYEHLGPGSSSARDPGFAIYDLPFFKNDNWFMKNVVGNWQFSPIYTFQSPEYATCRAAADSNLNGDSPAIVASYNPAGVAGTTSTRHSSEELGMVRWLLISPITRLPSTSRRVRARSPTTARNTLATPWINNWDFAPEARQHHRASVH